MAHGSDFVCVNKNCECFGKCLSVHGPWPLAKIEDVIRSGIYKNNLDGKQTLEDRKEQGRKFACIKLPNSDKLKVRGFRIQLYCKSCRMIWEEDIIGKGAENKAEKLCENPSPCPSCGGERLSSKTSYQNGIKCPSCNTDTEKCCWYTG